VYMNLDKAIAYFVQLTKMMAPVRAEGEDVKGEMAVAITPGISRERLASRLDPHVRYH
jgi:hypothetical protein